MRILVVFNGSRLTVNYLRTPDRFMLADVCAGDDLPIANSFVCGELDLQAFMVD